jgi:hypothetical protein
MIRTGRLTVDSGVSSLDGTTLARAGTPNPFGMATSFLANRNLKPNNFIRVDGTDGYVGNVPVFFITSAGPAAAPMGLESADVPVALESATGAFNEAVGDDATPAARGAGKAASGGKRPAAKAAKKSGGKRGGAKKAAAAKKGAAKKGGAKKGGAKKSGGGSTTAKRSAKKSTSKQSGKGARKR